MLGLVAKMKSFETYHPIVIFTFFVVAIGMTMFFMHPIYLMMTIGCAIILNSLLFQRKFFKSLKLYLPLFIIMMIVNPLISHNGETVLFYVNHNAITIEAILYGLAIATMLLAIMVWFVSYNEYMTSDKFLYLFSKVSPAISLTISTTMRLIPRFKQQLHLITNAQKTMGMDYRVGSLWHRIQCIIRILSILITWALDNAIDTADSMKARGYGIKKRSSFSLFVMGKRDKRVLLIILALFVMNYVASLKGYTEFYYYPVLSNIQWTVESIFFYGTYLAMLSIPIVIEVKEEVKWQYLKSKM